MRLTKAPSKIVGLAVGEMVLNNIGGAGQLSASFVLLRDPKSEGINAGKYTKDRDWSDTTRKALEELIECMESDALVELFEVDDTRVQDIQKPTDPLLDEEKKKDKEGLKFPTFGEGNTTPQF